MEFKKGHKGYWLGKNKPHTQETKDKISNSLLNHTKYKGERLWTR
jgi:hypothetical protein